MEEHAKCKAVHREAAAALVAAHWRTRLSYSVGKPVVFAHVQNLRAARVARNNGITHDVRQ